MRKTSILLTVLVLGVSLQSHASTGNANDGVLFTLVIVSAMLFIVGLIKLIDHLRKNGRRIMLRIMIFTRRVFRKLRSNLTRIKQKNTFTELSLEKQ